QPGKLEEQRVQQQQPRRDTSSSCSASSLRPATSGSLGLDLAAAIDITLMSTHPQQIPTDVYGPVIIKGKTVGPLLLGRSSISMLGLFVLPGVIDADYTGPIMIMAYTPFPPVCIVKGQKLAQLVPLEQLTSGLQPLQSSPRGTHGFGSTGNLVCLTMDLSSRPKVPVHLQYQGQSCHLQGLLDTGADSCIIAPGNWPSTWPLLPATTSVMGVGGMALAHRSPTLSITIGEKTVAATFAIAPLPPIVQCLIGRDVLSQIGLRL
ncbi:POK9 protein, partial [Dryoscopus gambensis]|nr:POK9 protein [Dryoscopus gambensis]